MKSFPAAFATELAKKTGISPVWILKLSAGGNDYYISDDAFPVAEWNGGVTTLPWVSAWGEVREAISGGLNEIRVADLDLALLIDPVANPNMETLATDYDLETTPVSLYLWFRGLNAATDPPQEMRRFYVDQVELPAETEVRLVLQDETLLLESYVGDKLDLAVYPDADPDDVGKLIPIPFGSVRKLPALAVDAGAVTSLPNSINASATSWPVSDALALSVNDVIQIDDEQIRIDEIAGDQLTVTRGHNATIAATHLRGAIAWEVKNQFVYLSSSLPVDSLDKIFGRVGEAEVDITAIATGYTGQTGNELAGYEGQAVVVLPGYITISQAVDLLLDDGLSVIDTIGVLDSIGVTDNIDVSDLMTIVDGIGVTDNIGVSDLMTILDTLGIDDTISVYDTISFSDNPHTHTNTVSTTENQSANGAYPYDGVTLLGDEIFNVVFPAVSAGNTITSQQVTISIQFAPWGNGATRLYIAGQLIDTSGWTTWSGETPQDGKQATWVGTLGPMDSIQIKVDGDGWHTYLDIDVRPTRVATLAPAGIETSLSGNSISGEATSSGTVTQTGSVDRSGTITSTGSASKTGSVDRSGTITSTGSASKTGSVSKTGTVGLSGSVTLSGNSTANTLVGDTVLVNLTRSRTPQQAFDDILSPLGFSALQIPSSLPAGYALNGAITEYQTALNWLDSWAFQLRSWFRITNGQPQLILRPDILASVKTIAMPKADQGKKVWSRRKVSRSEVINKIHLLFDRDWSKARADDAYRGISKDTDAASIGKYGELERPEQFLMDFITDQVMADSVRDFYLTWHATRRWIHEFDVFLDHADLEFADAITLSWPGNLVGQISEARHSPGDIQRIDTIGLVVVV